MTRMFAISRAKPSWAIPSSREDALGLDGRHQAPAGAIKERQAKEILQPLHDPGDGWLRQVELLRRGADRPRNHYRPEHRELPLGSTPVRIRPPSHRLIG